MKFILSIVAFLGVFAFSAQAQNVSDPQREGKAIAAFRQNCGYTGAVDTQSEVTGICFVDGYLSQVLITANLNCQQVNCDLVRVALLARVYFDCDGNVMEVECIGL